MHEFQGRTVDNVIAIIEKPLAQEKAHDDEKERGRGLEGLLERPAGTGDEAPDKGRELEQEKVPEPKQKSVEMDLRL